MSNITSLTKQNVSTEKLQVSELVADVTSEPDDLTAADISVSISVVDQLTQEATTNIVVSILNLTLIMPMMTILDAST